MPVHEHDCDTCVYIGSYPMKHPYQDDEHGYRTGTPWKWVGMGDVYLACDNSGYKYIVRYGKWGEYATTNVVTRYVKAPLIDGADPQETYLIYGNANECEACFKPRTTDPDFCPACLADMASKRTDLFPDLG